MQVNSVSQDQFKNSNKEKTYGHTWRNQGWEDVGHKVNIAPSITD